MGLVLWRFDASEMRDDRGMRGEWIDGSRSTLLEAKRRGMAGSLWMEDSEGGHHLECK